MKWRGKGRRDSREICWCCCRSSCCLLLLLVTVWSGKFVFLIFVNCFGFQRLLLELPNQRISSFDKAEVTATVLHLGFSFPLFSCFLILSPYRFAFARALAKRVCILSCLFVLHPKFGFLVVFIIWVGGLLLQGH